MVLVRAAEREWGDALAVTSENGTAAATTAGGTDSLSTAWPVMHQSRPQLCHINNVIPYSLLHGTHHDCRAA